MYLLKVKSKQNNENSRIRIRAKITWSRNTVPRFRILDIELANKFLKVLGTTVLCLIVIYLWFGHLCLTNLKVYSYRYFF
jgi:hypothetical protein